MVSDNDVEHNLIEWAIIHLSYNARINEFTASNGKNRASPSSLFILSFVVISIFILIPLLGLVNFMIPIVLRFLSGAIGFLLNQQIKFHRNETAIRTTAKEIAATSSSGRKGESSSTIR